jgi:2-polyprenyl-3-methyl-5-hydroxy-6-metoxy-1,4-benzoquinol methylase
MPHTQFDAAYYQRFYVNPRTRATSAVQMEQRATAVAALMKYLELPVRRILDAGCGLGLMRPALLKAFPAATYVGLEVSEHLCERFGWIRSSLAAYRTRARFDLVICYDVLQYLSEREASRALATVAKLCRGAFYFHATTSEDWRDNVVHACSDNDVHLRSVEWYRQRLARNFDHAGFGLHIRRGVPFAQWELERP